MAKQMAREKRPEHIDTEDHVTERVLEAAAWAESHRRAVMAGGVALVLVVAAAFYYQDYRNKLVERASVRLQEIQISAQSSNVETIRSELQIFIDQYASTPYSSQARVALGDLELRRDSLGLAIQALEPVADLGTSDPLAYSAMKMIAAAYEQGGDTGSSLEWYERISSGAKFEYQRRFGLAEQARLHTTAGRYAEAATLYEELLSDSEDDPTGQEVFGVRLGEVRALAEFGAAPPAALPAVDLQPASGAVDAPDDVEGDAADEGTGD
ncbi:MAG: tetratricopeptide repeat protein [Gemmatimonadetes bacterium]|nr:tetratricopeptide repeat protein [Gemmatimonadota bacterium]